MNSTRKSQSLRRRNISRQRRNSELNFEALEGRRMMAGTWSSFTSPTSIGTMLLMTDGTVLAHGAGQTNAWFKLTPTANGNYQTGSWSNAASMQHSRLYYGSNVLTDGRILVMGGEYSSAGGWTNTGEIYNPLTNTWSPAANFPQSAFGDGQTVLLPSGRVIGGYLSGVQTYLYNPATNSWSATGNKIHGDRSNEETWTLLPDGDVLSYDIFSSISTGIPQAQRYDFATSAWTDAGVLPSLLSTASIGYEIGGAVLLPNGLVFQIGGNEHTALYNPGTNTWTAGPNIPGGRGADDAPAAIMPDGKVIFTADTPLFNPPTRMFEYDYQAGTIVDITATLPSGLQSKLAGIQAYRSRMLMLPTGQMLFAPDSFAGNTLYLYTPSGTIDDSWRPTITSVLSAGGSAYTLSGTQLTGRSAGASYGDDAEMDTNFPVVQLTARNGTGNVYYARSYGWTPGVATGTTVVSTQFQLPAGLPSGEYDLRVIASGIASKPVIFSTLPNGVSLANGTVTNVTDAWQTVTLPQNFTDPIVVAGPVQAASRHLGTVRIRNVTSNSFQIQFNEWDYLDGTHGPETVSYFVLNRGASVMSDGTIMVAGSTSVTDAFASLSFAMPYAAKPVVLATVASANDAQAVTVRMRNVSNSQFQLRVQEEEANDGIHPAETVTFLAALPGIGQANGMKYEIASIAGVSAKAGLKTFGQTFSSVPKIMATMQTFADADPANVEIRQLQSTNYRLAIREDASLDFESIHAFETVGIFAFGPISPGSPGEFWSQPGRPNPLIPLGLVTTPKLMTPESLVPNKPSKESGKHLPLAGDLVSELTDSTRLAVVSQQAIPSRFSESSRRLHSSAELEAVAEKGNSSGSIQRLTTIDEFFAEDWLN